MASFGENLRRERELRGISLRDIADATKISARFLSAIEEDRLDILPGGLFPRAFVRQYARHLGLDAERLVADFVYFHEGQEEPESEPAPADEAPRKPPAWGAAAAAGVLVTVASLWLTFAKPPSQPRAERLASPPPLPLLDERVYPSPAAHVVESTPEPDTLTLTLSALQSCWVAVEVDGETVLNRVLSEGETQTLEASSEIVLSVGNAGGLTFSVNNQPGMPLGQSGEVRKNIVINAQSLPTLVEDPALPATRG